MCRFIGYLSRTPVRADWHLVRADHALVHQSHCDCSGERHLDGWGVGYYLGEAPVVAWSAHPASQDLKFQVASRSICARAVIAHVRAASVGSNTLTNTHPFSHGPWLFAHNGTLRPFEPVAATMIQEIPPALFARRRGSTDSELIFYWLLARMARAGLDVGRPAEDLASLSRVTAAAIRELAERCLEASAESGEAQSNLQSGDERRTPQCAANDETAKFNFMLTDGAVLLASRSGHSLFWSERHTWPFDSISHANGKPTQAVIVTSEPTDKGKWHEVPESTLVSVSADLKVSLQAL